MKTFSAASILLAIAGVVTKNHWGQSLEALIRVAVAD